VTLIRDEHDKKNLLKIKEFFDKIYCFKNPNIKSYGELFYYSILNTFSFSNISSKNGMFEPLSTFFNKKMQKKIDQLLLTNNYDLIYSDSFTARYTGKAPYPKIVDALDVLSHEWLERFHKQIIVRNKIYWYIQYIKTLYREKRIYSNFNCCIVVTEKDKELLCSHKSNVKVVPNGIDLFYFKPIYNNEDYPSLIYVGNMKGPKNIDSVLYFYYGIFPLILEKIPNVKFYIVGNNPPESIKKIGNNSSVIVTGFVDDLREYLKKSSIFICPQREGTGIKNKVLEAMAMAKPVVSTTIGVLGIDGISGREFIITDTPKNFAFEVIRILKDKSEMYEIGKRARELIEKKYSWEVIADNINKLIKDCVEQNANI
jgi:glycosyltransferase involved in cell wall biosynthesis